MSQEEDEERCPYTDSEWEDMEDQRKCGMMDPECCPLYFKAKEIGRCPSTVVEAFYGMVNLPTEVYHPEKYEYAVDYDAIVRKFYADKDAGIITYNLWLNEYVEVKETEEGNDGREEKEEDCK